MRAEAVKRVAAVLAAGAVTVLRMPAGQSQVSDEAIEAVARLAVAKALMANGEARAAVALGLKASQSRAMAMAVTSDADGRAEGEPEPEPSADGGDAEVIS